MDTINPPIYHITFLRHGESVGNADGYHQGQFDFELTENGQTQARLLADYWLSRSVQFDAMISSPLLRARQTAEILSEALSIPLEIDPLWMELNNGVLGGLKHEVAAEKYPVPDFRNPYTPMGQTGESVWELYLRAGKAVQSLLNRPPARYLIVSHGGTLGMALRASLGITPQANWQGASFRFLNTSYAILTYDPQRHKWILEQLNARPHLPED